MPDERRTTVQTKWKLFAAIALVLVLATGGLIVRRALKVQRLRSRIANSISETEKEMRFHSLSVHIHEVDGAILDALQRAKVRDLKIPVIAVAWLYSDGHRLTVEWIEEQPTVDGVELLNGTGNLIFTMRVPQFYVSEFSRQADAGVVYTIVFDTLADGTEKRHFSSEEWAAMQVVLMRGRAVVSAPAKVLLSAGGSSAAD